MNDLIRPALYDAWHEVRAGARAASPARDACLRRRRARSARARDFLAKDRELARRAPGDLLAIMSAGAYGMAMSSNYNTRPRAAEVMVIGRRRATWSASAKRVEQLFAAERILP